MQFKFLVRADWRAPTSAILVGAGAGLSLGAAYMVAGMGEAASTHTRAERLAQAAAVAGFSDSVLHREAAGFDPGVMRLAGRHDPFTTSPDALPPKPVAVRPKPAQPFRADGPLQASRDLECLTQAVYFEARGETAAGQAAVAQVVLNRVRHPSYPKSVCAVVFQGSGRRVGCQFSFACDGSIRRGREGDAWRRAERVATKALSGAVMAAVGDSTHFHAVRVRPNWGPSLARTAQVGLHVFYRLGRGAGQAYVAQHAKPEVEQREYARLTSAPVEAPEEIEVSTDMKPPALAPAPDAEGPPPAAAIKVGFSKEADAPRPAEAVDADAAD